MNITEATDTNTVLRYLLGEPDRAGQVPSDESARLAAIDLANRAHKALGAGLTDRDVDQAWPRVQVCPAATTTEESPA